MVAPAIAIPVLAYGQLLSGSVPSYLKVTHGGNMKIVLLQGNAWLPGDGGGGLRCGVTAAVARGQLGRTWHVFVLGNIVFFSLNVLGNYYFNFRIIGEPHRLMPELDMIYIIASVIVLRWLWHRPGTIPRTLAVVVMLAAFSSARGYVWHAWRAFPPAPNYQERVQDI